MLTKVKNLRSGYKRGLELVNRRPVPGVFESWQGISQQFKMYEALNFGFITDVPETREELTGLLEPDLPWAEDHFQERVGGEPTNPGKTYTYWPYYKQDENWRKDHKFTHTYQERIWTPKYSSMNEVIAQLNLDSGTRQAYLPIFFPEDTGNLAGRVPCTIGYHFLVRNGRLQMTHYIRSCDVIRHFKNDLYLSSRLIQWMSDQLGVIPGELVFLATSLHCFESDKYELQKRIKNV